MKLVSTKRTKEAKKELNACKPYDGDSYSYNTCITLDKDMLEKLGMKPSDFDVDQKIRFEATGYVKSVQSSKGDTYSSSEVRLQLTKVGVETQAASMQDAVSKAVKDAS
jgi:hypothetical protein